MGVLLALMPQDLTIVQIAGDTRKLLGISPEAMLGRSFEASAQVRRSGLHALLNNTIIMPRPLLVFEMMIEGGPVDLDAVTRIEGPDPRVDVGVQFDLEDSADLTFRSSFALRTRRKAKV